MKKLGHPEKCMRMIRLFHDNIEMSVNAGGTLTDPIFVENVIKRCDIPAPT